MRSGWLLIPTGVFVAFGAVAVARLWPTRTSRLVVFGVTGFGVLVVTCQGLGVLAAVLRQPVVQPLWILVGSGAVALVCWRVAGLLRGRDLSWGDDDFPGGARALSGARLRDRVPALTVVAVALAVLSHSIVLGLSAPPRGWDVLAYHMPRALSWLQQGNLGNYGSIAAFYPGNGEIAILLSLFTGTDRLAPLVQLPFALLGGAALCGLARELGASARAAAVPAIVFFASPMVLFGSALAKNDLMVIGLVLGGALMLLRSAHAHAAGRAATLDLALSGFAFGLALGVKYSIFAFVLLSIPIAFLVQVWVGRAVGGLSLPQAGRFASRRILSFVGAMAIPSIFWFVQNWIVAGSPLAPLSTEMVARAFLRHDATYVSSTAAWWWFPWLDRATVGSYDATVGFGAAFAALGLPSTGLSVWMFLRARRGSGARIGIAVVLALIVVGAVTWWFGGHHMPRFLFPAVALACAPVALLFDRVVRHVRPALVGVLVLATFFSMSEVLRIVYRADDLRSSIKPFVTSAEHYQMPELVYELPPRTRILLIDPRLPGVDHFRTFKYPLAGHLPGNEVVMMGDVGTETDLVRDGLVLGHPSLIRDGIDYIFVRTLALPPGSTVFDNYPSLYTKVIDTVEEPYPWYREGFLPTPGEEFDLRAPVVTKMYKVLRRQ